MASDTKILKFVDVTLSTLELIFKRLTYFSANLYELIM
jgi:hypothetical protein